MESHHATVDKGLKMKIKKKKADPKTDSSRPGNNSHSYSTNFVKDPKQYQPSPLAKQGSTETLPCDKPSGPEKLQSKKDKHKHDKHGNKASAAINQVTHRLDAASLTKQHPVNLSIVKQEKTSKNDSIRVEKTVDVTQGGHYSAKHEKHLAKRLKESHNEHPQPQGGHNKDAMRNANAQIHDPYEFNSREEDQVNQATPGGLLHGLSGLKLKAEKSTEVSPKIRMEEDMRDSACGTNSVGVVTDPECLGPCEPGTSVVLEGIVWNETENGILVVNVTWRGKTYVGTLMDATRHDWAPPRFSCDSPVSDLDSKTPKGRGKRARLPNTPVSDPPDGGRRLRQCRRNAVASTSGPFTAPPSPAKHNSAGKRKSVSAEEAAKQKHKKSKSHRKSPVIPGDLIVCPEPDCNKKYRHINGLRYHQSHAHHNETDSPDCALDPAKYAPEEFTAEPAASSHPQPPLTADPKPPRRPNSQPIEDGTAADDKSDNNCDREVANLNGLGSASVKPGSSEAAGHNYQSTHSLGASGSDMAWTSTTELRSNERVTDGSWAPPATESKESSSKKSVSPPSLMRQGPVDPPPGDKPGNPASAAASKPSESTADEEALSPAYSDISDANECAPLLENQTESDCGAAKMRVKIEEGTTGERASDVPLGGYSMYGAYYGQPPYLTPAVSADSIKQEKTSASKEAACDKESAGQPMETPLPPSLQSHATSSKPFGDYSRFLGGYDHNLGQRGAAQSSPVGAGKSSDLVPKDLSSKDSPSLSKESKSGSAFSKLSKSDENFQILKENMEIKEQIRDKKDDRDKTKQTSHEKSFKSADDRYGFDKSKSDYQRYYQTSAKPNEKMSMEKGHTPYKKEDVEKGGSGSGSKPFPGSGKKDSRAPVYTDLTTASRGREEGRDGKGSNSDKSGGAPPRSGQSPSLHPNSHPYYPQGYPPYSGSLPYEANHPLMMGSYPGNAPFMHPHQLRYHDTPSPAHSPSSSADSKPVPAQHPGFYSGAQQRPGDTKSTRSTDGKGGPLVVEGKEGKAEREGAGGKGDGLPSNEPPVQRHLHSHHHTHVVGPAYPLYGPGPHGWNSMM